MRITILRQISINGQVARPGHVLETTDAIARLLINMGEAAEAPALAVSPSTPSRRKSQSC
jgi:hypothetical protein